MTQDIDDLFGGRYRVVRQPGRGGMGAVGQARDETLDRVVALKELILPAGASADDRRQMVERVKREARMAARLDHPGIVRVHDIIERDGSPVIVMEYVEGRSLAARIHEDGRPALCRGRAAARVRPAGRAAARSSWAYPCAVVSAGVLLIVAGLAAIGVITRSNEPVPAAIAVPTGLVSALLTAVAIRAVHPAHVSGLILGEAVAAITVVRGIWTTMTCAQSEMALS